MSIYKKYILVAASYIITFYNIADPVVTFLDLKAETSSCQ